MATLRPWVAQLAEQALHQYLNQAPEHSCQLTRVLCFHQGLSNLRVTIDPALLDTVYLLEIRDQGKSVKALVADTEHFIRATFTKAALRRPAITTSGVPFTHLQPGALFKILGCELRISDCFDPPTVELRISSVAVISAGHKAINTACLKRVEEAPSVLLKLIEYDSRRRASMDSDSENHEPMASQEDFMTQIPYKSLKAPSPHRASPKSLEAPGVIPPKLLEIARARKAKPLQKLSANEPSRDHGGIGTNESRAKSVQETVPHPSQPNTRVPEQTEKHLIIDPSEQPSMGQASQLKHVHQASVGSKSLSSVSNTSRKDKSILEGKERASPTLGQSLWQRRTATARYVPRYAKTIARDQQELIINNASWQPSLIGQPSMQGQVPIQLLDRLSRAADESAESQDKEADDRESSEDEDVDLPTHSTHALVEVKPQLADFAQQQSSEELSTITSWATSPDHQARTRPRLPPDSSPLRGTDKAADSQRGKFHPIDISDSAHPVVQAAQEMPSSPYSGVAESEGENSQTESPVHDEASAPTGAQDIMPDADATSNSTDHHSHVSLFARLPEGKTREVEETDSVTEVFVENSNRYASCEGASISKSIRKVQVSRTPAVQKRRSGSANTYTDIQTDNNNHYQNHRLPPHTKIASPLPTSSFVPATYLSQTVLGHMSADCPLVRDEIPAPEARSSSIHSGVGLKQGMKQADQSTSEHGQSKRKRESTGGGKDVKRQKRQLSRNQTVATGKDPDLIEWEIRLRQQRRDSIAKMDEQEHRTPNQPSPAVATSQDDTSGESRGWPQSARSSIPTIAQKRVSSPITRSSDYQLSHTFKQCQDGGRSRYDMVKDSAPKGIFELFRSTYPSYEGGRTQFNQACRLLRRLGSSGPQPWLWDDFVFRYNNDYMAEYDPIVKAAGELPLPFELFYTKSAKKPISLGRVLDGGSLPDLSNKSVRQSTPGTSTFPSKPSQLSGLQSLGVGSSTESHRPHEPLLPSLPPPFDDTASTETDSLKRKSQSRSLNHSQNSSVKLWLEKVPGAASPELGTPPLAKEVAEVPKLDLEAPASSLVPAMKSKARKYPWPEHNGQPSSTALAASSSVSTQNSRNETGKARVPRRHTDFPLPREEHVTDVRVPVVFHKPPPNAEMPFVKLSTQFAELDGRRGIPNAAAQRPVDIFSWRR